MDNNESTFFHRYKEIILGIFILALAAFYLYCTANIQLRKNVDVAVNVRTIPYLLGCIAAVLGGLQIWNGVRRLAATKRADAMLGKKAVFASQGELKNVAPILLTFVIILLYAILFERLGFIISSTLCMLALMLVLTPKSKFRPLYFAMISLIVSVVVYIAFNKGLDLSLPRGVLENLGI